MVEKALEGGRVLMSHYSREEWKKYIKEMLPTTEQKELEQHLYSCDECLELYMTIIDESVEDFPNINSEQFTEKILAQIFTADGIQSLQRNQSIWTKTIVHYGIAAAITMLMMVSGFFYEITNITALVNHDKEQIVQTVLLDQQDSISVNIMNRVISMLDSFKPLLEEGQD